MKNRKEKYKTWSNMIGHLKILEVGSGAMGERASSVDRSHPPYALGRNRENRKSVNISVINNGLTIDMKNVSQHST